MKLITNILKAIKAWYDQQTFLHLHGVRKPIYGEENIKYDSDGKPYILVEFTEEEKKAWAERERAMWNTSPLDANTNPEWANRVYPLTMSEMWNHEPTEADMQANRNYLLFKHDLHQDEQHQIN